MMKRFWQWRRSKLKKLLDGAAYEAQVQFETEFSQAQTADGEQKAMWTRQMVLKILREKLQEFDLIHGTTP